MEVALEEQTQRIATHLVESGRYPSTDAVINEGLRLVEEQEAKLAVLRAMIAASDAEGGEYTDAQIEEHIDKVAEELRRDGY